MDILINNAGIVTGKKFMDSPDSLIQKTMAVNTMAPFWVGNRQSHTEDHGSQHYGSLLGG